MKNSKTSFPSVLLISILAVISSIGVSNVHYEKCKTLKLNSSRTGLSMKENFHIITYGMVEGSRNGQMELLTMECGTTTKLMAMERYNMPMVTHTKAIF